MSLEHELCSSEILEEYYFLGFRKGFERNLSVFIALLFSFVVQYVINEYDIAYEEVVLKGIRSFQFVLLVGMIVQILVKQYIFL